MGLNVFPTKFLFVVEMDLYFYSSFNRFLPKTDKHFCQLDTIFWKFRFAKKHEQKNS